MSELFQASQAASVADPAPALGLQFLPAPPPRAPPSDSSPCSGACCSPPWLLYLFILHQQGCCRLIPVQKKRRGGKKKRKENASWLFSLPQSWQRGRSSSGHNSSLASRLMRQAAGQQGVGSQTHRGGGEAKVQLEWDRPQPWRDAAPNLMPSPSFSGK